MKKLVDRIEAETVRWLKLNMDSHAYLYRHGQLDRRDYHARRLMELNDRHHEITRKYYTYRHADETPTMETTRFKEEVNAVQ